MKIMVISRGGEEVPSRKIPLALLRAGATGVVVVTPVEVAVDRVYDQKGRVRFVREDSPAGYHLFPVPLKDPDRWWLTFREAELTEVIRSVRPDVIQLWGGPADPELLQVLRLNRKTGGKAKVFFYGFDNLPIDLGPWYKAWYWKLFWRLVWKQTAGGFEADSEGLENIRKAGYRQPAKHVFWGIPGDIFYPMGNRESLKEELAVDCVKVVGYVGRFVKEKGLDVFLSALGLLPPEVHCLMIGEGPLREALLQHSVLPGLSGRVHILNPVPSEKLVKYLNCMDVLTLSSLTTSSWKEQYGRVLGEAMACGVPVVGSNSGAIPEVIGDAGLVVPEGNPTALAGALKTMIFDENLRKKFIRLGLHHFSTQLSVMTMAGKLYDFYSHAFSD